MGLPYAALLENVPMLHFNYRGMAHYMAYKCTFKMYAFSLPPPPTPVSGMSGAFLCSIRSAVVRRGATPSTSASGLELDSTGPPFSFRLRCSAVIRAV